jgi:enoyl-CoA hydratase/carnithine racemase
MVVVNDAAYGTLACLKNGNYVVVDLAGMPRDETTTASIAPDLADVCERIAWDEQVRVVVLSFDERIDKELHPELKQGAGREGNTLVAPVAKLKQPVIAAIRGDAIGLGLELALACDIRIGAENARFGLTQIREGRMPSNGGTQRLPRLIGQSRAMQMILTGDLVDAEEACRLGILTRKVPSDILMQTTAELARELAEKSPLSLNYAKEALYKGMDLTLDQGIQMELDLYLHLFTTADRTEGISAYKEKRKPKFKGA